MSSAAESGSQLAADIQNLNMEIYLGLVWAAIFATFLTYRMVLWILGYIRQIASLGHDKQRIFAYTNSTYAFCKRHLLYAPLFRRRHHREFMLSDAVNVGTLPSRPQAFFLIGYVGMNVALCVIHLPWSADRHEIAGYLRNRTGVLSVMNMIPLFLFAGRNNPLIWMLDISFDGYNLMHRWIGRTVVLQALAHTLAWTVDTVMSTGWNKVAKMLVNVPFFLTGTIGAFAMVVMLLHSPSVIRHAFYEVFLGVHFLLAATAVVTIWMHLQGMPQQLLLKAALVLWIVERATRFFWLIKNNVAHSGTKAEVILLPGDAVRVTLHVARPWTFRPGQHVFLYMPRIGLWTSHPFSLAWSDEDHTTGEKGLSYDSDDVLAPRKTTMSLIIRRRTGFTERLFRKAENSISGTFTTTAFVEGPYGSQNFDSYGTVMLFAAGVGITHQVPHVRALVAGYANGTCATRRVVLVWIIQSPEHLEWIRPWMTQILGMEKRRDVLKVLLFITRPRSVKEIHSPSSSVQMYPGKPDVGALVAQEQHKQVGAMAVSVCGTGSLSDDVRKAVRDRCETSEIDFVENAFSCSIHGFSNDLDKNAINDSSYISFYDYADDDVMDDIVYGVVDEYKEPNNHAAESETTSDSVHHSGDTIDVAMNESLDGLIGSITAVASKAIAPWLHGVLASPEHDTIPAGLARSMMSLPWSTDQTGPVQEYDFPETDPGLGWQEDVNDSIEEPEDQGDGW